MFKNQYYIIRTFLCFLIIFLIACLPSSAQIVIKLPNSENNEKPFLIKEIIDERQDTSNVGMIDLGFLRKKVEVSIKGGVSGSLSNYFKNYLSHDSSVERYSVKISELQVIDYQKKSKKISIKAILGFYSTEKNIMVYQSKILITENSNLTTKSLTYLFLKVVNNCFTEFYKDIYKDSQEITSEESATDEQKINSEEKSYKQKEQIPLEEKKKSSQQKRYLKHLKIRDKYAFAIGYRLGGYTSAGFEVERMVYKKFGLNLGCGVSGYTVGIKFHPRPERSNAFIHLNYKDGGFGSLDAWALEIGTRVLIKWTNIGIHGQVGALTISKITDKLIIDHFFTQKVPPVLFSFGIGLAF